MVCNKSFQNSKRMLEKCSARWWLGQASNGQDMWRQQEDRDIPWQKQWNWSTIEANRPNQSKSGRRKKGITADCGTAVAVRPKVQHGSRCSRFQGRELRRSGSSETKELQLRCFVLTWPGHCCTCSRMQFCVVGSMKSHCRGHMLSISVNLKCFYIAVRSITFPSAADIATFLGRDAHAFADDKDHTATCIGQWVHCVLLRLWRHYLSLLKGNTDSIAFEPLTDEQCQTQFCFLQQAETSVDLLPSLTPSVVLDFKMPQHIYFFFSFLMNLWMRLTILGFSWFLFSHLFSFCFEVQELLFSEVWFAFEVTTAQRSDRSIWMCQALWRNHLMCFQSPAKLHAIACCFMIVSDTITYYHIPLWTFTSEQYGPSLVCLQYFSLPKSIFWALDILLRSTEWLSTQESLRPQRNDLVLVVKEKEGFSIGRKARASPTRDFWRKWENTISEWQCCLTWRIPSKNDFDMF